MKCSACDGTGRQSGQPCHICHGTGQVPYKPNVVRTSKTVADEIEQLNKELAALQLQEYKKKCVVEALFKYNDANKSTWRVVYVSSKGNRFLAVCPLDEKEDWFDYDEEIDFIEWLS